MYYTFFRISNFKGIQEIHLDLEAQPQGRIHTLVGLNESGKTTILEAIDYFTGGEEEKDTRELVGRIRPDQNGLIPISRRANFNGSVTIQAGVHLTESDIADFKKYLAKEFKFKASSVPSDLVMTDEYLYANSKYQKKKVSWTPHLAIGAQRT